MGSGESKLGKIPQEEVTQGSVPSTPIAAPKSPRNFQQDELDPRSPTANICRTPIQTYKDDSPLNETPKHILLDFDPRSPSAEISRTPIVVSKREDDLLRQVHRRNAQKTDSPQRIAPKLLDSSPVSAKPDANKRKSFVGILETNIDFTETDIDSVQQLKKRESVTPRVVDFIKAEDPRSPSVEFLRTPLSIGKQLEEIDLNVTEDILTEDEVISDSVPVAPVVEETEEEKTEAVIELPSQETPTEEVVKTEEPVEINEPSTPEAEQRVEETTTPSANVTANVKDFDRKLTELIYEDKNVIVLPRVVKLRDQSKRPLGVRNSTGDPKRNSVGKLKVSDKSRKSEGLVRKDSVISKIPVFKDKTGRRPLMQCENTPPRNMEKRVSKIKKSQWDSGDNTLVI